MQPQPDIYINYLLKEGFGALERGDLPARNNLTVLLQAPGRLQKGWLEDEWCFRGPGLGGVAAPGGPA